MAGQEFFVVSDFFLPGFGGLQVKAHFLGVQKKGGALVLLEVEALNSCSWFFFFHCILVFFFECSQAFFLCETMETCVFLFFNVATSQTHPE